MAKRFGLVIDQERCIGCHACTVACKLENGIETGSWTHVETVGGAEMDTASGTFPHLSMYYTLRFCMHCANPPCLDACPTEAIYKRDDGIVLIDAEKCNGCLACVPVCPYNALTYNEGSGVVEKCTLCSHRIDQGLEPFCVLCCEGNAMLFGDLEDPDSAASRLVTERQGQVLEPDMGTRPAVYFCPPLARAEV
ncbi:MAG: 4Fe-4S dicluster domain-containing protein [Chloroflexota bacterium]